MLGYYVFLAASLYQPNAEILVICSLKDKALPSTQIQRSGSDYRLEYLQVKTVLSGGSLLFQLFDTHTKRIFWLGYANNLWANDRFSETEGLSVAAARVIDRFRTIPVPHYLDAEVAPSFVQKK